jgi:hypothetical protein
MAPYVKQFCVARSNTARTCGNPSGMQRSRDHLTEIASHPCRTARLHRQTGAPAHEATAVLFRSSSIRTTSASLFYIFRTLPFETMASPGPGSGRLQISKGCLYPETAAALMPASSGKRGRTHNEVCKRASVCPLGTDTAIDQASGSGLPAVAIIHPTLRKVAVEWHSL